MPEYLAPGVHVEEVDSRPRPIEGVPTSTLGMVGVTEFGPVPHPAIGGNRVPGPVLVTSAAEYERAYGGLTVRGMPCRLALAAHAFFANGGQRLYVQRVFVPTGVNAGTGPAGDIARVDLPVGAADPVVRWEARWPGAAGARVRLVTRFRRSENIQVGTELRGVLPGAAVETAAMVAGQPPVLADHVLPANLHIVTQVEGVLQVRDGLGGLTELVPDHAAFHITLDVEVHLGDRVDLYEGLELGAEHPRSIEAVIDAGEPADQDCPVRLIGAQGGRVSAAPPDPPGRAVPGAAALLAALVSPGKQGVHLVGGSDGDELTPGALRGQAADSDSSSPATGLAALDQIDDIAMVAMPDSTYFPDEGVAAEAVHALLTHCEQARSRFALIDPPANAAVSEVRAFRSRFDSSYGALYYPWLRLSDLAVGAEPGMGPTPVDVPPSGAVAGVFARSDLERGVHKAPVNEVLRGVTPVVAPMSASGLELLTSDGVNVLRSVRGRGPLVWGARTLSSDPEWKYVNVRRLFIHLEHSIEKATQWAVFEPNDESLWMRIRRLVDAFLTSIWRSGALMGTKAEEAYFVRCDRTTMTQNDLDNGRLICLVGVAAVRPAEFVIFRIGHLTADAPRP